MEAPKREGGRSSRKNGAVLCSCREPARLVVVPTSRVPGQRCWRCANPHVQCMFALWHGPWVNERSIAEDIEFHERIRARARVPNSTRSTEASASASSGTAETSEESKEQEKS